MAQLIDPDLLSHTPPTLHEGIDEAMAHEDHRDANAGHGTRPIKKHPVAKNRHENDARRVHAHMPEQDSPVLGLLHHHPGALEGEVTQEVRCKEQQQLLSERGKSNGRTQEPNEVEHDAPLC